MRKDIEVIEEIPQISDSTYSDPKFPQEIYQFSQFFLLDF
jgi:hypothetical protein